MSVLKNPRHELMAQWMAKGKTAVDAYELAGYKRDDGNAIHMAQRLDVQARLQEITGAAAKKTIVTVERIIRELAELAFCNLSPEGLIRANDKRAALVDLGKHLGMFQENVNVRWPDGIPKRASISYGRKLSSGNGRSAPAPMDSPSQRSH
jgi:hypothetical protein